jgi:enamine deaminase RidA (YjgF/YER057c/UK114 family)
MIDVRKLLMASLMALGLSSPVLADSVTRVGSEKSAIATAVSVPAGAKTLYVSGQLPAVADPVAPAGTKASYGDTKTQSLSVLKKIDDILKAHGMTAADVVNMHVYLMGDPDLGGKMDFAGMMDAYTQFYGTAEQPNKPSRATIQVAALAGPGYLVEIEVIAAKMP